MKKFKIVIWLIIVAFLGLFFYQNNGFFMEKPELSVKLPMMEVYHLPVLPNAILFLAVLLLGLLVAYFFSLLEQFKANKEIKGLNATIGAHLDTISGLKSELSAQKTGNIPVETKPDEAVKEGTEAKV